MDSSPAAISPPATSKRRVFVTRLSSTVVLWSIVVFAFWANQHWLCVLAAAFFGIAGAFEYYHLLSGDANARSFRALGLVVCAGYWLAVSWHVLLHKTEPPMWIDLAALVLAVQGAFLLCYRHELEGGQTLQRIFSTVFGVVYTAILFGFLLRLMYFGPNGGSLGGLFFMLFLVMVTKFCDMGAYAFGVLWGRHKMIPRISPAKSWEGLAGAFVGGFVAVIILLLTIPDRLIPLNWVHGLVLAPVLCLAGVAGDLAESVIKRCAHTKDSGHALPGIGGILDLTDSLLFTAPIFYFYLAAISQ